jgi:hypothetical protein
LLQRLKILDVWQNRKISISEVFNVISVSFTNLI